MKNMTPISHLSKIRCLTMLVVIVSALQVIRLTMSTSTASSCQTNTPHKKVLVISGLYIYF